MERNILKLLCVPAVVFMLKEYEHSTRENQVFKYFLLI